MPLKINALVNGPLVGPPSLVKVILEIHLGGDEGIEFGLFFYVTANCVRAKK